MDKIKQEIFKLKNELNASIVAHFYQKDEVYEIADFKGDSLELARWAKEDAKPILLFCGVGFMGQSVKILAPKKRVFMPKIACCSMAKMIDSSQFDKSIEMMRKNGINDILPITYINSSAEVKASVGKMGGFVCTSSNASKIMQKALKSGKKIFFLPDSCLGRNLALDLGLNSAILGKDDIRKADVICYDGYCLVHQLFSVNDIEFYKNKHKGIKIAVHPECQPEVCKRADFVGSTSQIIKYVTNLDKDQKVAVGTEFNLVNRLRKSNTYVLSKEKPECPTMNETSLNDVLACLSSIKQGKSLGEINLDEETREFAKLALDRMFEI